jgi:two-component system response regulator RpfG
MGATIALRHQERFDGSGYPDGLAGDQIPLEARIVAVADVFDALVSKRPYKRAWSVDEALEYIEAQSGKLFDPACAAALLRSRERVEEICQRYPAARVPGVE